MKPAQENQRFATQLVSLGWLIVIIWLVFVYFTVNLLIPRLRAAHIEMYLLSPVLWLSPALIVYWLWKTETSNQPLPVSAMIVTIGLGWGILQVSVFFVAGIFEGFGYSPYARRLYYVALNLWFVGSRLVGWEMTRWYLVHALGKRRTFLGVFAGWLLLTLAGTTLGSITKFSSIQSGLQFTGMTLLPAAAENLLATYLVWMGGPFAGMAYRGMLALVEWGAPILPDLSWLITAFLGTILPIGGIVIVYYYFIAPEHGSTDTETVNASIFSWIAVSVVIVCVVFFNTGIFGVQPTLISGYSMKPTFVAGDMVITRDVEPEDLRVGDVIRFEQHGVHVLHRIIEIETVEEKPIKFITLGDNNQNIDPPVEPEYLRGKVVVIVPRIGWISIAMRRGVAWLTG